MYLYKEKIFRFVKYLLVMEENKEPVFRKSIKHGMILGLVFVLISVVTYVFDVHTMSIWSGLLVGVVNILTLIILLSVFAVQYRNSDFGGYIKFGKAYIYILYIIINSSVLVGLYTYAFNGVIDPEFRYEMREKIADMTEERLEDSGMSKDEVRKTVKEMREQKIYSPIASAFWAMIGNIILGGIFGLISAAIAAKKKTNQQILEDTEIIDSET